MKKILISSIVLVFSMLFSSALSAEVKLKIGYININTVLNSSHQGKKSIEFLKSKARQSQKLLEMKNRSLMAKEEELKNNIMLNDEAKKKKLTEIQKLRKELKEELSKAQAKFRKDEVEHTGKIINDVMPVIKSVSKKKNLDLVLEYNIKVGVLYSKHDIIDLTKEVIQKYDKLRSKTKAALP